MNVERVAVTRMPTRYGEFTAYGYRSSTDGAEHVALVHGTRTVDDPLVRVHSECLTGEVFGSLRCDCGPQLAAALEAIAAYGHGCVVYLRGHEGRGIGLLPKLAAYTLQDAGHDTVDANLALGLPADARDYSVAARILADLGQTTVRLLTNNPAKTAGLRRNGITVIARESIQIPSNPENVRYLRAKRERLGHQLL
jgi:3,4-dihydroxy 2-butanone 4-phosphate synthase / GTP cyclohydrolase II